MISPIPVCVSLSETASLKDLVRTHMRLAVLIVLGFIGPPVVAQTYFNAVKPDRSISGNSAYPTAIDPGKVGKYPARAKSGGGYFYDDVLEYRVWLHPDEGAEKKNGNSVYFAAFAEYEKALAFSRRTRGTEEPLVLVRQMKHVNEPSPGVFKVVEGERIAEWRVEWLSDHKRVPGAIKKFLAEHKN
jgi:hypothetical protein